MTEPAQDPDLQDPDLLDPDLDDPDLMEPDVEPMSPLSLDGALSEDGASGPVPQDELFVQYADDADALGTEVGGFGPDRQGDATVSGIYSSDEMDDVRRGRGSVSE